MSGFHDIDGELFTLRVGTKTREHLPQVRLELNVSNTRVRLVTATPCSF